MFAIPVYIGVAWIFLLDASKADRCWMSSYPYHYKGCSKWTLFKVNDQGCTEIVLGGHSTSLFDKRRTHRLESPFLSTNHDKFRINSREDQTVTPESLGGNTQGVHEYTPSTIIDLLQTTGYKTIKHRNYISTTTQSSGDHDRVTAIDYTSDADDASSTSRSAAVSSEFISTKTGVEMSVSVTEYKGSSTNALAHTVDNISNGNNVSITEYQELETNRISTTKHQHSSSDSSTTTDYQQLDTTGNQQVHTNKTSTTLTQKLESDATSTSVFQQSSSESMSTSGYQQPHTTWYYDQTSVPTSTVSHGDEHESTDHATSKTSMSTLTTSFNMNATKPTIEKSTTPNVTPALTLENVFYTTTSHSSTFQKSLMSTQVTTTTPISTITDNHRSTTSAYCRSTIYKTEDYGAFQLFIETLGGIQNMQFQAKAINGIRVRLLTSLTIGDFVEVKIGGKANDRSEIKSCSRGQCALKTEVTTLQYLTSEEFREFWVEYIPGESLSVGRTNEETPFMKWIGLPSLLDIKYAAFSTDDFKAGDFRFCSQNGEGFQEIASPASAPCPKVVDHLSCTCELPPLPAEAKMCRCLDSSTDVTCLWLPNDCHQLWQNGVVEDGNYTIYPTRNRGLPFHVYCDMTADEGWTMLQRRVDGSVDFYRDYESYKKGFGPLNHEFWLGNEKIFHLTNQNNYTLRIDMVIEGEILEFAEYDAFRINDETDDFRLASLGSFTGSVYDAMTLSLGMKFSTFDYDRDLYGGNCASVSGGSWWYNGIGTWCYDANLNGIYGNQKIRPAIVWYEGTVNTFDFLLTYVDMKIRPNSGRVL